MAEYAPVIDLNHRRLQKDCAQFGATPADIDTCATLGELVALKDRLLREAMRAPGNRRAV